VLRQPHGEEDICVAHAAGTVIVSVTAKENDSRPIRWNKAKEILALLRERTQPTMFALVVPHLRRSRNGTPRTLPVKQGHGRYCSYRFRFRPRQW
jgi:hypothetical protein